MAEVVAVLDVPAAPLVERSAPIPFYRATPGHNRKGWATRRANAAGTEAVAS